MKKVLYLSVVSIFIFWLFVVLGNGGNLSKGALPKAQAASTGNVLLTGTVLQFLDLTFASGQTISFGNITPGLSNAIAKCGDVSTQANVTTNASGGYNLAVSDGSDTNSALMAADSTYIPDITGTIATPLLWTSGVTAGVGINLFSGTQKSGSVWGTGTTVCDLAFDKWGKVPSAAATGHTVTGYHATADSSYWGWRIGVPLTQKTGTYSGNVLFTSAAVL